MKSAERLLNHLLVLETHGAERFCCPSARPIALITVHRPRNSVPSPDQQRPNLPPPIVSRAAGFPTDQARRQLAEKPLHITTAQPPAKHHLSCRVSAFHLKNVLG